jgi:membrane associated rhomboid family serine protease
MAALAVLRRTLLRDAVNEVWQQARQEHARLGRHCPACGLPMREVHSTAGAMAMHVDVCPRCTLVWFDPREYEAMPLKPEEPPEEELPPEAREALALAKVEAIGRRYREERTEAGPESTWQMIVAIFGMPVETDAPEIHGLPWVTWTIVAVIIAVSSAAFYYGLEEIVEEGGLIPAQAFRDGGITFITSFFLHGGIFHLLGNIYFLLVFGDNVEDYLGKGRYLLLLLLATLAGGLAHIAANPASTIPCVGASGGIAGVMTCYALSFPNARFGLFLRHFYYFRWISLPVWGMILLWVALQLFGAWQQINGFTNVSAFAHLGGAGMGVLCWMAWRNQCA